MADTSAFPSSPAPELGNELTPASSVCSTTVSLQGLAQLVVRRRRLAAIVLGGMLAACLLYCLIAPNKYEAHARVALRQEPSSTVSLGAAESMATVSLLSAPLQQETLAQELRSEQLAWTVITRLKLYEAAGFGGRFGGKFPGFHAESPEPAAHEWLLKRFARELDVESVPHTLLVEIRFRCRDAMLSAAVVNELLRSYNDEQNGTRRQSSTTAATWLNAQLEDLKQKMDRERQQLVEFQNAHGILSAEGLRGVQNSNAAQSAILMELDELGRQVAAAGSERILAEAAFRAALDGDPEAVAHSANGDKDEDSDFTTGLLQQLRKRRSALQEEMAQLSAEHGPNFPRVVEIGRQIEDLDRQRKAEDARLIERFRSSYERAVVRERQARKNLDERTAQSLAANQATSEYGMRLKEFDATQELYLRLQSKAKEAGLLAGLSYTNFTIVDPARTPAKPVAPDLPLYLAITFFVGLWLALAAVLLAEALRPTTIRAALLLFTLLTASLNGGAQPPTPTTSGLPAGVSHPTFSQEQKSAPNAREAPTIWEQPTATVPHTGPATLAMPAPIAPGDVIEIHEFHMPEMHSIVRVANDGTVTLPMLKTMHLEGLDEQGAAQAIEAALIAQGVLLHPRVTVLVTAATGQDVSVLGEVGRPGIYPYTVHHRLLDLVSAASGLTPTAGRLVSIYRRDDPHTALPVVLDPTGSDPAGEHNPELQPGDTVQVSRAGLVYVIGDVVRPGGFAVDPAQGLTAVQALSLAWGPAQNAATAHALLIREQKGGRTLTPLNLKRMLRGQEPDQPIHDRDILFVPDSTAKNLWNKSLESAIQSAVGVTIYSALVYSQRY